MTVDRELVTRKLLLITQDLDAVAPFATKPLSTFLRHPTTTRRSSNGASWES